MECIALIGSALCYLYGFGHTLFSLGKGRFQPGRYNVAAVAAGASLQSCYLWVLGLRIHACPIRSLPEILVFLGWSMALFYLIIGPSYRLSLMGAFTAPIVLLLQMAALLVPEGSSLPLRAVNPWVEMHAALSLVAYGAFGLSCVSGLMYLVQERQLKSRNPSAIFHHLHPIADLFTATRRLLGTGFLLLTLSFLPGFAAHLPVGSAKFAFSGILWLLYGVVLAASWRGWMGARRVALGAVLVFLLALLFLPLIQRLSIPG
jgi:ABC-type uncharacterized transport system permease subunit